MKEQEDKKFQRAIIVSAILHLVLLGVFFLGFPSVFEKLPEEQDVMTFEILQSRAAHSSRLMQLHIIFTGRWAPHSFDAVLIVVPNCASAWRFVNQTADASRLHCGY